MFSQCQVPHTLPNSLHSFWSAWTSKGRHTELVSRDMSEVQRQPCALTHSCSLERSCFQHHGAAAGAGQEACGVAVLSKMRQAEGIAKNNIVRATKELVKELKGDVPQGRNTFLLTMGSFIIPSR